MQGIRRIVAVTGQEAAEAIMEAEGLANQLAAAQKLEGQQLEKEVAALKQVRTAYLLLQTLHATRSTCSFVLGTNPGVLSC